MLCYGIAWYAPVFRFFVLLNFEGSRDRGSERGREEGASDYIMAG